MIYEKKQVKTEHQLIMINFYRGNEIMQLDRKDFLYIVAIQPTKRA